MKKLPFRVPGDERSPGLILVLGMLLSTLAGCDAVFGIPGDLKPATTSGSGGGGAGGTSGAPILREGRLATLPATPVAVGTSAGAMRVSDQVLEHHGRVCSDGSKKICVSGGISARGRGEP